MNIINLIRCNFMNICKTKSKSRPSIIMYFNSHYDYEYHYDLDYFIFDNLKRGLH